MSIATRSLRHLGLNHPELGKVTNRVRVLSTESGSERVDIAQRTAVGLHVQLARDGHLHVLAEEVFGIVNLSVLGLGNVLLHMTLLPENDNVLVQHSGHSEHLASSLAVGSGDDRRVDVLEATLLEEEMGSEGAGVAHSRDSSDLRNETSKVLQCWFGSADGRCHADAPEYGVSWPEGTISHRTDQAPPPR